MGKITEWVILESDFGTGGKWLFLDMPLTYPINIKCKARNIGGVNGGWNGVEYFNLTWTSASDVKIKDIQTIGKIELFDNGNGTFSCNIKSTRNAANVATYDYVVNGKSLYNYYYDGHRYDKGIGNWRQVDVQVKPFTFGTHKVKQIINNGKKLSFQRTISNTWIDGTNYNSARQHFKEAPSTDILFFRNLVAHGDIGNETRTNTTQQGWNGGQAIMYEHWYAYYGQQTWNHKTELSLHLNEFITEAKKHDVAEVEIMLYGRSNSKSEWYKYSTGGETHSFPITINIETGEVSIIDINGTKHIVPNDNSQINLGGWNTGNNRIEFSVWQQNGVLFMAPWIKWQNQSWVATCYFTSWRYRKYE